MRPPGRTGSPPVLDPYRVIFGMRQINSFFYFFLSLYIYKFNINKVKIRYKNKLDKYLYQVNFFHIRFVMMAGSVYLFMTFIVQPVALKPVSAYNLIYRNGAGVL